MRKAALLLGCCLLLTSRDAAGAFTISPALRMFFAPNHATIFTDYLTGKPLPAHSNGTLGGRRTSE